MSLQAPWDEEESSFTLTWIHTLSLQTHVVSRDSISLSVWKYHCFAFIDITKNSIYFFKSPLSSVTQKDKEIQVILWAFKSEKLEEPEKIAK